MSSLLLKNGYILTLDDEDTVFETGDLLIEGNTIKRIASTIDPREVGPDRVINAAGRLVMPGLINAHIHSDENLLRGTSRNLPNELFGLVAYPPIMGLKLTSRAIYLGTVLGALEMVKSGTTTVQDNSYCWFLPRSIEAEKAYWSAYKDVGMRTCVAVTARDRSYVQEFPYLESLLPEDILGMFRDEADFRVPRRPHEIISDLEAVVKEWHRPDGRMTVAVGPSAPQRCSDELLVLCMECAEKYNLGYHTHLLETRIQRILGRPFYGTSITRHLYKLGVLKPRTSVVHAVWVTDDDIQLLAENDCTVVHSPLSNLRMASGIMPLRKMLQAGITVGLATDGAACNDTMSMRDAIRFAALVQTVTTPDHRSWPTSNEILRMSTSGSARCLLAQDELGSLSPGKRADVILLNLRETGFTPLHNIKNQLAFSYSGSVTTVIVDGEVILEDGCFPHVDEQALLDETRDLAPDIIAQHARAQALSSRVWPYMDQIYHMAISDPN